MYTWSVEDCVLRLLSRWRLPPFCARNKKKQVHYFVLKSTQFIIECETERYILRRIYVLLYINNRIRPYKGQYDMSWDTENVTVCLWQACVSLCGFSTSELITWCQEQIFLSILILWNILMIFEIFLTVKLQVVFLCVTTLCSSVCDDEHRTRTYCLHLQISSVHVLDCRMTWASRLQSLLRLCILFLVYLFWRKSCFFFWLRSLWAMKN